MKQPHEPDVLLHAFCHQVTLPKCTSVPSHSMSLGVMVMVMKLLNFLLLAYN